MKHKKKKINHAKKSVASNKRQAIDPMMIQNIQNMMQQQGGSEEAMESGADNESMEGGMGDMMQRPAQNYKGKRFR